MPALGASKEKKKGGRLFKRGGAGGSSGGGGKRESAASESDNSRVVELENQLAKRDMQLADLQQTVHSCCFLLFFYFAFCVRI